MITDNKSGILINNNNNCDECNYGSNYQACVVDCAGNYTQETTHEANTDDCSQCYSQANLILLAPSRS